MSGKPREGWEEHVELLSRAALTPAPGKRLPAREEREPCPDCDGNPFSQTLPSGDRGCASCSNRGSFVIPSSPERVTEEEPRSKCPKCKGQGHVEIEPYTIADCPKCAGNGWLRPDGSPFPWVFKDPERVTEPRVEEARFPRVVGRCPACGNSTLFVGEGGYVTCSLIGCTDPCAASDQLEANRAS